VRSRAQALHVVLLLALCGLPWADARAGALRYCDSPAELDATQQDTLFRFAAVIKTALDTSGHGLALIARAGFDLSRFDMRYSHAGVSVRANPNGPWSVRQLYFDCDQKKPRVFDQGMSGFVTGTGNPNLGYVSVLLLPEAAAAPLERAVLDNPRAVLLVGPAYSANAYAFDTRYQNCNQWVAEMLAVAWGGLADAPDLRLDAQRWLQDQRYQPATFDLGNPLLMWLGGALPWLHSDDHPQADLDALRFRVSMPASIEDFVRARLPEATRLQFCHAERRVVVRRGWAPIAEGCVPQAGDTVVALD